MADQKEQKEFLDIDGLVHLWERIKDKLSQNSGGGGAAIVDVTELPTENIKEDVLYRLLTGTLIYNGEPTGNCTCHCVPSLPETGQPVSDGVNFVVYYNQQDGVAYGYAPAALAAPFGLPAGWYTLDMLAQAMGMTYGGVVTNAEGTEADTNYVLVKYDLYFYKDGWSKIVKSWDDLQDRPFYEVIGWSIDYDPQTFAGDTVIELGGGVRLCHVSDMIPSNSDLKKCYVTVSMGGGNQTSAVANMWDGFVESGYITETYAYLEMGVVVRDATVATPFGILPKTGCYVVDQGGYYVSSLFKPDEVKKIDPKFLPEAENAETIGRAGEGEFAEVFNGENSATGDYSHAEGSGTTASGIYAHAEGHETRARGEASHAEGYNTETEGQYSSASGDGTKAWGYASRAEGIETKAFADGSHAEGYQTETYNSGNFNALYSHAEGHQSWARGYASHAEGSSCAEGRYSHAEGASTGASGEAAHSEGHYASAEGTYAHAEGDNSYANGLAAHSEGFETLAYGQYAHAEGKGNFYQIRISGDAGALTYTSNYNVSDHWVGGFLQATGNIEGDSDLFKIIYVNANDNTIELDRTIHSSMAKNSEIAYVITGFASGEASHTEGYNTKAEGEGAHAEGCQAKAIGDYAHAEGYFTQAEGQYSHAEGGDTRTTGQYSHAEGYYAYAEGPYSHAEGATTSAYGEGAHAEGRNTIARGDYQHVQGKYNVEDAENKYAHIVGNGTGSNARSNAHTVDWEGNGWYKGDVYVGGNSQNEGKKLLKEGDLKTETWTFTLEDGSTVTKAVYVG